MSKNEKKQVSNKKHAALSKQEQKQQKIIITVLIALGVIIVGSIVIGVLNEFVFQYNRPIVTVNDDEILPEYFEKQVSYQRYQLIEQYLQYLNLAQMFGNDEQMAGQFTTTLQQIEQQLLEPGQELVIGSNVLDQLTNQLLIKQEAEKRGIVISEEEVDKAFEEAFGYFADGTPTPQPTSTQFVEPTLSPEQLAIITVTPTSEPTQVPEEEAETEEAAEPTPTSEPLPTATAYTEDLYMQQRDDYLDKLSRIGLEFTVEDLRDLVRYQLLYEAVREDITAEIAEVEEHLWARHILVNDAVTAEIVLESLAEGKDWNELASELSLDTSNKDQGGDLGWFPDGQMVEAFWDAANALEVGETSEPVETQFGVHIIQLLGRQERPLAASVYENKVNTVFQEWLIETTAAATIEISDEWENWVTTTPQLTQENLLRLQGQEPIEEGQE